MINLKISLIIPFYNAEKYLKECLVSVQTQLTRECEIILIDDGSKDQSAVIVKEHFAKELETRQAVLLKIPNSGPGEARNVGVRVARGSFIGFLDSDDLLLPGYFDEILKVIKESEPQVIQFHLQRFRRNNVQSAKTVLCHRSPPGNYSMDVVRDEIFSIGKWFPVTRVFEKNLLLNHPFPSKRVFYEDLVTLPLLFLQVERIVLLNAILIGYRDNESGTTRNHRPEHAETLVEFFRFLSELPEQKSVEILRVQVGRGIAYFVAELGLHGIDMAKIIVKVRKIRNRRILLRALKFPDAVFLMAPGGYLILEKIRQFIRNCWRKI